MAPGAAPISGAGRPLEGQYIIKNMVIISASLVIGGQSLRGGKAVPEPGDG
jgi:hypothetical protein